MISRRFKEVNRRLSISLYYTLGLLSVALLVAPSTGTLPNIHGKGIPTPHLDEGRSLPSDDTIIGTRSRPSRKRMHIHDGNQRGDGSAAMHGNNDSGYNNSQLQHGSGHGGAPSRNYSHSHAQVPLISNSTGSYVVALPKRQQTPHVSNITSSIKDHSKSLMTPARTGRELLDNSWYWFCDTFNGPVCATCQQLPDGNDPCMVGLYIQCLRYRSR